MAIEVEIRQPATSTVQVLRFSKSPIRIGRNQLNDIPLDDPFVSEWHGIIRSDDRQIAYFDLGSTNGTVLDGRRLAKNVPVILGESAQLNIGTLMISVVLRGHETSPADVPTQRRGTGPTKTIGWGSPQAKKPGPSDPKGADFQSPFPASHGERPLPAVEPYQSTPFPRGSSPLQTGDSGPATPPGSHGRAAGGSPDLLARQAKFIEAFSEAFVGLRKGYEQFGAEVGVRTVSGSTPLHRARTARDVVDHLMLPGVDPNATVRDLIAIFADFGIHHIALMEGITESVRALLQSLDPRSNNLDPSGRLWNASKSKNNWKSYIEQFNALLTDDEALHAAIFGDSFARAYASVALGDGRSDGENA